MTTNTNTNKNKKMKVAKQMYTVFTPYGNEVYKTPWLEVAIKACDKKSILLGGDCYIEDLNKNLIYESCVSLCEC